MPTEEIEVCCTSCNFTTSTTKNEWVRWGTSHIWPVQKPWYTASTIDETKKRFPHRNDEFDLSAIMVSETSCTNCGAVLGGYCKSARGSDAKSFKYVGQDFYISMPLNFRIGKASSMNR